MEIDGGLYAGEVVAVAANLDGSFWVRLPSGPGLICVPGKFLTDRVGLPVPANPHGLTALQVEVLVNFARAGRDGLADFEHGRYGRQVVAEARRVLASRALVLRRDHTSRTDAQSTGHVWVISRDGRDALQGPCPRPALATA